MNQRKTKQLRKVLLTKTSAVLLLIREHYGEKTEQVKNAQGVWRKFKKLYKEGKVPQSLLILQKESE